MAKIEKKGPGEGSDEGDGPLSRVLAWKAQIEHLRDNTPHELTTDPELGPVISELMAHIDTIFETFEDVKREYPELVQDPAGAAATYQVVNELLDELGDDALMLLVPLREKSEDWTAEFTTWMKEYQKINGPLTNELDHLVWKLQKQANPKDQDKPTNPEVILVDDEPDLSSFAFEDHQDGHYDTTYENLEARIRLLADEHPLVQEARERFSPEPQSAEARAKKFTTAEGAPLSIEQSVSEFKGRIGEEIDLSGLRSKQMQAARDKRMEQILPKEVRAALAPQHRPASFQRPLILGMLVLNRLGLANTPPCDIEYYQEYVVGSKGPRPRSAFIQSLPEVYRNLPDDQKPKAVPIFASLLASVHYLSHMFETENDLVRIWDWDIDSALEMMELLAGKE